MVWVQGTNNTHTNFFGVQYRQKMWIVGNESPDKIKVHDWMDIKGTNRWEASDGNGSFNITIPENAMYPLGMKSRLVMSKFTGREGEWHADFLRDANTPNMPNEQYALINGRALRGYVINIILENGYTEYTRLFAVKIHSTPSEKS